MAETQVGAQEAARAEFGPNLLGYWINSLGFVGTACWWTWRFNPKAIVGIAEVSCLVVFGVAVVRRRRLRVVLGEGQMVCQGWFRADVFHATNVDLQECWNSHTRSAYIGVCYGERILAKPRVLRHVNWMLGFNSKQRRHVKEIERAGFSYSRQSKVDLVKPQLLYPIDGPLRFPGPTSQSGNRSKQSVARRDS